MDSYIVSGIIMICVIILLLIAWYVGKKEQVKKIIHALVIEAERNYGTGTGKIKYEVVVGEINKILPPMIGLVFTPVLIDEFIDEAVEYIKTKTVVVNSASTTIEKAVSKIK